MFLYHEIHAIMEFKVHQPSLVKNSEKEGKSMQNSFQANRKLRTVLANGIIMGLYIVLSLLVRPVSSGMIQFRISESLNHLVVFNRKLMWGVLGGVIFFNLFLVSV